MKAPSPPGLVVLVVGTGTDVGKTWVTCRLLEQLRQRGLSVAARKPAQSFAAGTPAAETDAGLLASASGEARHDVCPPRHWYPVAMAPPMAASVLGRPVPRLADLAGAIRWPARADVGVVEAAGGVGSPQADDGDCAALCALLSPGLTVLVSRAGLGAIGEVRLCVGALGPGYRPAIFLNGYDPADDLHARNRAWLAGREDLDVVIDPVGLSSLVVDRLPSP